MEQTQLKEQLTQIMTDILAEASLEAGDLFVLGCSTSEIQGGTIGKNSHLETGRTVVSTLREILMPKGIFLAVQGCEHINRALVVEKEYAKTHQLEIVAVKPVLHAGGACSVAAFEQFENPVEVEHIIAKAGVDLGDTSIGMHVKHVQVPIRPFLKELGGAHVTALKSRPKYIGGIRAHYE